MAQRPVLKDGIVVNVIEIEDDTEVVSKDRCKQIRAEEDARYERAAAEWRGSVKEKEKEIREAGERLGLAKMTVSAMKVRAAQEKNDTLAAMAFRSAMAEEENAAKIEAEFAALRTQTLPPKPKLTRAKLWFHPEGLEIGPAGGNIGDMWNGQEYSRPTKEKAA
jgi:hypothetical protein